MVGQPENTRTRRRPNADDEGQTVRLTYRAPFDWDPMRAFLAARAIPGVEAVSETRYERTLAIGDAIGTLALTPVPARRHVRLSLRVPVITEIGPIVARARRLLDLDADLARIGEHLRRTPYFAARAGKVDGGLVRVPGCWNGFELSVRAILGQQVSVTAATTMASRLAAHFGTPTPAAGCPGLTRLFPTPAQLLEADLLSVGLVRGRATAIKALADAVLTNRLSLEKSNGLEDLVSRLCALPGIGPWTAHYIAMRAAGEPDAFPSSDLGLRRALGTRAAPVTAADLEQTAEAWRPWRAYAAMYLWTRGATGNADPRG